MGTQQRTTHYHTLRPSPALADAVSLLWAYEGYRPPHVFERVFPSGTPEIVINLTDGELRCYGDEGEVRNHLRGPILTGVQRRAFIIDTRQQSSMVGVHLKPGGVWRLLGVPASELTDAHIEWSDLVGADASRLIETLLDTRDPQDRLRRLDHALLQHSGRHNHPAVTWAADQFSRYPESARVTELADEAGLSLRRFNELFTREVGINPKSFVRIRRFQTALAHMQAGRITDWTSLAVESGYADQAHFIRDFKEFTGLTPTTYAGLIKAEMNHVALGEQSQICPVA
jgi:AraC-like DNA-binding protein